MYDTLWVMYLHPSITLFLLGCIRVIHLAIFSELALRFYSYIEKWVKIFYKLWYHNSHDPFWCFTGKSFLSQSQSFTTQGKPEENDQVDYPYI